MQHWNKAIWLVKNSHGTWNSQLECFMRCSKICLWHLLRRYFSCVKVYVDTKLKNLYSDNFVKVIRNSVTKLGYLWKALAKTFLTKVDQMFGNYWVQFWKHNIFNKNILDYLFICHFGRLNWATFYSNVWSHLYKLTSFC